MRAPPPGPSHHVGQVKGVHNDLILLLDLFERRDHSGGLDLLVLPLHDLRVCECWTNLQTAAHSFTEGRPLGFAPPRPAHLSLVAPLYLDEAVLAGVVQHEAVDFQLIVLHLLPSQRHLLQLQARQG